MATVTLVDLTHLNCPEYYICLEKRIRKLCANTENGSQDLVFITVLQHVDNSKGTDRFPRNSILETCAGLPNSPQVLCQSSLCASLYAFKQAIDKEEIADVKIVTSTHGRVMFQVYQELLFTSAYTFEYIIMFDNLSCPLGDPTFICTQTADVKREVNMFLQHLPAVKGDITIIRSSLISGWLCSCFLNSFLSKASICNCKV